jgi:hypothetical protein
MNLQFYSNDYFPLIRVGTGEVTLRNESLNRGTAPQGGGG